MKDEHRPTYPELDKLSTQQLDELLYRTCMFSEEGEDDLEDFDAILEVIYEREQQDEHIPPVDVDAAWREFQDYYLADDPSLADDSPRPETSLPPSSSSSKRSPGSKKGHRFLSRLLPVAAAVVVILCSVPVMTSAFGFNLFEVIAGWTSEQFTFSAPWRAKEEEQPAEDPYEYLRSAVAIFTDEPVVPNWFPSGTQAISNIVQETMSDKTKIAVTYEYDSGSFYFMAYFYNTPQGERPVYQKDDNVVSEHITHGITHYIMENNGKNIATWRNGNAEVIIQGDLTTDELEEMIDSIYKE